MGPSKTKKEGGRNNTGQQFLTGTCTPGNYVKLQLMPYDIFISYIVKYRSIRCTSVLTIFLRYIPEGRGFPVPK
jgi:hypothetical protein